MTRYGALVGAGHKKKDSVLPSSEETRAINERIRSLSDANRKRIDAANAIMRSYAVRIATLAAIEGEMTEGEKCDIDLQREMNEKRRRLLDELDQALTKELGVKALCPLCNVSMLQTAPHERLRNCVDHSLWIIECYGSALLRNAGKKSTPSVAMPQSVAVYGLRPA